jgi:hypothetical protein
MNANSEHKIEVFKTNIQKKAQSKQIKADSGVLTLPIAKALECDLSFAKEMMKSLRQGAEENATP